MSRRQCGTRSTGRWKRIDDIPDCPNINWIKLGERAKGAPRR
jgi:hypothetical protein